TGNVYLRARYYNPIDGRFLTKDTWEGDVNRPISMNRWNYVEGNPINLTDPTGKKPSCGLFGYFSNVAVRFVDENVNLNKTDWLNTYTAAGIAVQCWAESYDWKANDDYDGLGPGKITNKQKSTPYGNIIRDDEGVFRGEGLLCYLIYKKIGVIDVPCTICENKDYMDEHYGAGNYRPETPHDQTDIRWAAEYMKRRIKIVIEMCREKKCGTTDIYIAAALAQNEPAFSTLNF